jgi:hypothetical protein
MARRDPRGAPAVEQVFPWVIGRPMAKSMSILCLCASRVAQVLKLGDGQPGFGDRHVD